MNSTNTSKKRRLFIIDILRVLCAFQIYAYHSTTMYGCDYGYAINTLLSYLTSPVMTCFFVLSGFSIHYQHRNEEITAEWIRVYLKKG
jgi:peptidoglycan/LPS O-acetylase OafA/YrhL